MKPPRDKILAIKARGPGAWPMIHQYLETIKVEQ